MRYRSKPSEIDAYQLTKEAIFAHLVHDAPLPGVRVTSSEYHRERGTLTSSRQCVTTIQGETVYVSPGEWIVQEHDGKHYYPIADDVFRRKYEPAA